MITYSDHTRISDEKERGQGELSVMAKNQIRLYVSEWRGIKKSHTSWVLRVNCAIPTCVFCKGM